MADPDINPLTYGYMIYSFVKKPEIGIEKNYRFSKWCHSDLKSAGRKMQIDL